jgi:predicted HTH domain antitoxin
MKDAAMHAVNVSTLKNNPTQALQWAETAPVWVMNRDRPQAVITGVDSAGGMDAPEVKIAMAAALFRDGGLSLVRGSKLAGCTLGAFIRYLGIHGIPAINMTEEDFQHDMDTMDAWLNKK